MAITEILKKELNMISILAIDIIRSLSDGLECSCKLSTSFNFRKLEEVSDILAKYEIKLEF